MVTANKLLIESVKPAVRKALVRERIRAMQGQLDEALHGLERAIELVGTEAVRETVALATLRAELLHLNRQDAEALAWYRDRVLPIKSGLDTEEQFVVEQNLADLEFSAWSPDAGTTFYGLVDRRRMAGFEWFDAEDVLVSQEAAAVGKHYEALPIIWRQAVRAYHQGCWLTARRAAKRLAEESLQLGSLVEAAHYAVTTPVNELIEKIAEAALHRRDLALIQDLIRRLIGVANLRRHFSTACELLHQLGDAIPDNDLAMVVNWLLPRCAEVPDGGLASSTLNMAWKALEPIAHRLEPALAHRAIETAFAHSIWRTKLDNPNGLFVEREQLVKTANHLVAAVTVEDLAWIAQESLPLALDRRQLHDYDDMLILLCHVAERGGAAVKKQIADALLAPGKPLDPMLIQIAPRLKDEKPSPEQVRSLSDKVAREIALQVQHVAPGDQAVQLDEIVFTFNNPDQNLIVSMVGGIGLHAVARYRQLLPTEALKRLVNSVLTMANERENFLGNRTTLLHGLMEFADRIQGSFRQRVFLAIAPLAKGLIEEPVGHPRPSEVENPLNPNKFRSGDVSKLRSMALVTLAKFASCDQSLIRRLTRKVLPILEEAIYDHDPEVRRGAYAALARLPKISEPLLLAILVGARDPDPNVTTAAFFAMAKRPTWKLTRNHWRLFIHALRLAAQSPHVKVRRNAAAAAATWANRAPNNSIETSIRRIQALFRSDICASVREAANRLVGGESRPADR